MCDGVDGTRLTERRHASYLMSTPRALQPRVWEVEWGGPGGCGIWIGGERHAAHNRALVRTHTNEH